MSAWTLEIELHGFVECQKPAFAGLEVNSHWSASDHHVFEPFGTKELLTVARDYEESIVNGHVRPVDNQWNLCRPWVRGKEFFRQLNTLRNVDHYFVLMKKKRPQEPTFFA
ncbi:hypothetical protein [Streptomyces lasiicapitis]|uniref:hypothetical protein n=1 Tax=Streptomyces lasiicapitis TaxID=1923961 RepID=UPI00166368E6|nr:hypothetical protein [Streptomyces lasiicapitis]